MREREPRLERPLVRSLDHQVPAGDVDRWWAALEARRAPLSGAARAARTRWWGLAAAAAVGAAAVALVAVVGMRRAPERGPLRLASGEVVAMVPLHGVARTLVFEDGAEVTMGAETQVLPVLAEAGEPRLVLEQGWVRVTAGEGAARAQGQGAAEAEGWAGTRLSWVVLAGLARVEVLAAQVRVERTGSVVRVAVERGTAQVIDAEGVVRRAVAGDAVEVRAVAAGAGRGAAAGLRAATEGRAVAGAVAEVDAVAGGPASGGGAAAEVGAPAAVVVGAPDDGRPDAVAGAAEGLAAIAVAGTAAPAGAPDAVAGAGGAPVRAAAAGAATTRASLRDSAAATQGSGAAPVRASGADRPVARAASSNPTTGDVRAAGHRASAPRATSAGSPDAAAAGVVAPDPARAGPSREPLDVAPAHRATPAPSTRPDPTPPITLVREADPGLQSTLARVDALRGAGRLDEAAAVLGPLDRDCGATASCAVVGFMLGRIEHDRGQRAASVDAFQRALRRPLPTALEADALRYLEALGEQAWVAAWRSARTDR